MLLASLGAYLVLEDAATRQPHPRTGPGLAISSALCRLMGFDQIPENEPGEGFTFSVFFSKAVGPGGDISTGADREPTES